MIQIKCAKNNPYILHEDGSKTFIILADHTEKTVKFFLTNYHKLEEYDLNHGEIDELFRLLGGNVKEAVEKNVDARMTAVLIDHYSKGYSHREIAIMHGFRKAATVELHMKRTILLIGYWLESFKGWKTLTQQ